MRSKDWFALIFHNIPIKYIKLAKTHYITFIAMWFGHYACEVGVSGRVSKLVYVYLLFICDVCDIWFYKWVNVHLRKLYIMFFLSQCGYFKKDYAFISVHNELDSSIVYFLLTTN